MYFRVSIVQNVFYNVNRGIGTELVNVSLVVGRLGGIDILPRT